MVIGHLCVVDKAPGGTHAPTHHFARRRSIGADRHALHALQKRRYDVRTEIARIGARIGQELMLLVKALHQAERLLRGQAVFFVRVALQLRQVV